jgi:hypothetical protein
MRFVRTALALTILSLVIAADAPARPPGLGVPRDAVPVAGPTSSGARLFVWDEHGDLCGSVVRRRAPFASTSCGPAPKTLRDPWISVESRGSKSEYVWGVVAPEVASVEIVTTRGHRFPAPASEGARYHGKYAGKLRFFVAQTPERRSEELFYVRLLDASGALLAAVDPSYPEGPSPTRGARVARGRLADTAWSLRVSRTRELSPLPGDEERVVTPSCVALFLSGHPHRDFPQTDTNTCDEPDFPRPVDIALSRTCGPVGIQIAGLADAGVRLQAVLGDGTRRRLGLHALPKRFGARRAFALLLAPKVALRKLVAIEGGRRHVEVDGIGPGVMECPDSSSGYFFAFALALPKFGDAPPALQVRDNGVLLCATLGRPDPDNADCGRPPLDAEGSWILSQATDAATTVAGVVPPEVGSAEVVLANGRRQLVSTAPPGAYSGRYRDLIRTFSLSLPGHQEPRRVVLYGPDGKRLASLPIYSPPSFAVEPTLLTRSRSGWRLGAGVVSFGSPARRAACLQLVRGAFSSEPFSCALGPARALQVTCSPKRTLLYGWLPGTARAVDVVTTKRHFSRRGLPAHRLGIHRSAFFVELDASEALRSMSFRGRKPQRFRAPAAAAQCGYGEDVTYR